MGSSAVKPTITESLHHNKNGLKRARAAIFVAAVLLVAVVLVLLLRPNYDVNLVLGKSGIKSLKAGKTEFMANGDFRVNKVLFKRPGGQTYLGATDGASVLDASGQILTDTFPWGRVEVTYKASRNVLSLAIKTVNNSESDSIQGLQFEPFDMKFPSAVSNYDGTTPLLMHNIGDVAAVHADYGSKRVVVVSDDVDRPLMVGFPWALDRPKNTVFPVSVHTDRVESYPDSYPLIARSPIPPRGSDEFHVSVRFGKAIGSETQLAPDVYQRFAEAFPARHVWPDRRPVGAIFLATVSQSWPANPAGWFGDSHIDVTTADGRAEFRGRILSLADTAIAVMRSMNAQGAITWDIEGQRFAKAGYVGDPRLTGELAPEMDAIADEYFAKIRSAGLRVGICVRPQQFTWSADKKSASQTPIDDPTQLLIDKIAYAKKRWGVTLVYVDSNANPTTGTPMNAAILAKVADRFPDVLLIPEHSTLQYYAYSAPYEELRKGGLGTAEATRVVYPKAFSLIYTADGALDLFQKNLIRAVKHGDSLMYRTWYADPQNDKVRALFQR